MLESEIEKKIVRYVQSRGGMCLKWVSPGFTGVPDRIILMPGGKIFFAELKRPGEKLRPRQKRVHDQLTALGAVVLRIESVGDLKGVI